MKDVEKSGVGEHNDSLKYPEEPLIFKYGTYIIDIASVQTCSCEILDSSVDRAYGDECATAIQHIKGSLHFAVQNTSAVAIVVELASQSNKPRHQCDLQDQGSFE